MTPNGVDFSFFSFLKPESSGFGAYFLFAFPVFLSLLHSLGSIKSYRMRCNSWKVRVVSEKMIEAATSTMQHIEGKSGLNFQQSLVKSTRTLPSDSGCSKRVTKADTITSTRRHGLHPSFVMSGCLPGWQQGPATVSVFFWATVSVFFWVRPGVRCAKQKSCILSCQKTGGFCRLLQEHRHRSKLRPRNVSGCCGRCGWTNVQRAADWFML